jgi:hypothetical protein
MIRCQGQCSNIFWATWEKFSRLLTGSLEIAIAMATSPSGISNFFTAYTLSFF